MTLPDDSQRMLMIGRTGSGKTQFSVAALSHRSYDRMPWVILNFKDDDLIGDIPAIHLDDMKLPNKRNFKPGIYIARPELDDPRLEALLADIGGCTHVGTYIDEGLPVSQPRSCGLRRLLTQGRSRKCPLQINTQRPVDLDRYAFSESEFIGVMELTDDREAEKVKDIAGLDLDMSILPKYHAYWFDRGKRKLTIVRPVPDANTIIDTFY